jgi:hypothetical protein
MTFFFEAKINTILSKEYRFFFYYFYQAYFYNVSTTFCLRVSVLFFGINLSAKYTFVIKPGFISIRFSIIPHLLQLSHLGKKTLVMINYKALITRLRLKVTNGIIKKANLEKEKLYTITTDPGLQNTNGKDLQL